MFAAGKIKAMHETVSLKIDTFLEILEEKSRNSEEKFDIYEDFQRLSLDIIGKCAFAIDSNCQRDETDVFYVQARKFVSSVDIRKSWILIASFMLPELSWIWKALYRFTDLAAAEIPLINGLSDIYERRLAGEGYDSVDLLKLLLDRGMSKKEVTENCFAFLIAGYETSSTAMVYGAYLLAKYPDVQRKLYEEIKKMKTSDLSYESIHQMKYLDAFYKETLRYYPPVIHFNAKVCQSDITIRNQFYPKGCVVKAQPYTIHRLSSNWERPEEFDPNRFLFSEESSSKLRWIPFGIGPRYCIGMRFAEMEFKTTMVKLVEKFELGIREGEDRDLIPECVGVILRPKGPVRLELKLR
ncbi:hypothetical protein GCK72_011180 [Caenorhabditis remanei]|uniref:Uncharacterized protein n=1 Tax=Caenorhabditis remanei TaxID=31234 RepID=A0A6A5H7S6_CAERE|nr:hypothetical protein GCK72_011180 [Caenorhabditis remanei]KAF1762916.1 hypothetical protein GCK72_011180 [Caenorhabditis remanei]